MNMTDTASAVSAKSTSVFRVDAKTHGQNPLAERANSYVTATVTKNDGKNMTLTIAAKVLGTEADFSFEADASKVSGQVGDELVFQILKAENGAVTLKQIRETAENTNNANRTFAGNLAKELFEKHGFDDDTIAEQKEQKQIMDAVSKVKRRLSAVSQNATRAAIGALASSGLSIEKLNLDALSIVTREAQTDLDLAETGAKLLAEDSENAPDPRQENAAKILQVYNLDASSKNLDKLSAFDDKWQKIQSLTKDEVCSVLSSKKPLTVDNIYIEKFSYYMSDKANSFGLDKEISRFLSEESFQETPENTEWAKRLIEYDIPLTRENMNKALFLSEINKLNDKSVYRTACHNIEIGKNTGDINLYKARTQLLIQDYNNVIERLPKVTANDIQTALSNNVPLTLQNVTAIADGKFEPVFEQNKLPQQTLPIPASKEALAARISLLEIQYKLTVEAATRLANKGININVMPVANALETLRRMERSSYETNFRVMNAPATEENMGKITALYDKIRALPPLTNSVFGDVLTKKIDFSINGLHDSVTRSRKFDAYEAAATRFNQKYGDGFEKVEGQFGDLLKRLGIEKTDDNIRAAQILSKNNIDVNQENLLKVLNIDLKVNSIYNRLHPNIAVDMLKNNLNPAEMHVDEVLEYIDKFNDEYGTSLKDKIAECILEMEDKKELDTSTKDSVLAIYRMLAAIQKNGGAALGVGLRSESTETLGNLFKNTKYYNRHANNVSNMDFVIDDKSLIKTRPNVTKVTAGAIKDMLQNNLMGETNVNMQKAEEAIVAEEIAAKSEPKYEQPAGLSLLNWEHSSLILRDVVPKLNTDILGKFVTENPDFAETTLDKAIERLAKLTEGALDNGANADKYEKMLNELKNVPTQVVQWLSQNAIPVTINNIGATANIVKKKSFIADNLTEIENDIKKSETDKDILREFEEIGEITARDISANALLTRLDEVSQRLSEIEDGVSAADTMKQLRVLQTAVSLQGSLNKQDANNHFQMPIKLHDKIGSADIYVMNENLTEGGEAKLYMSLNTTYLGNVSLYINTAGDNASVKIGVEDLLSLERIQGSLGTLKEAIEGAGFGIKGLSMSIESVRTPKVFKK
ncbi:hypothetical protein AGMMS49975_10750 [Clostridia bacterium]|nr:hypothetical protein AGMMS49975_10750 [Clostridia bacterium]